MGLCDVFMRPLAAGSLAVMALLWGRPALALEPEQWLLGGSVVGSLARGADRTDPGLGVLVEAQRGLGDVWAVRGGIGFDVFRASEAHRRQDLAFELGGVAAFDVLRTVPFAEVGLVLALVDLGAPAGLTTRAGLQVGLGAEYLIDRFWSAGAVARAKVVPLSLGGPDDAASFVVSASLRLARRF